MPVSFEKSSVPSMPMIYKLYYDIIKNDDVMETFSKIEIALAMFLSMMVTNCTGESSFSKLK